MTLAFVSTSATAFDYRGKFVRVLGDAAYGRNQSECQLLDGPHGTVAYVKNEDLHKFDVRKDVDGFVVLNIRPDGYSSEGPSHRSLEEACRWFADTCVGVAT